MWVVHLKNGKDPATGYFGGLVEAEKNNKKANRWYSCCWDFDPDEARKLIGGMIFLHETKAMKSGLGGRVLDIIPIDLNDETQKEYLGHIETMDLDPRRPQRVKIMFEITPEGRDQKWRGKDHSMSWTSGIIEV